MVKIKVPFASRLSRAVSAFRTKEITVEDVTTSEEFGVLFPGSDFRSTVKNSAATLIAYSQSPWLRAVVWRIAWAVATPEWTLLAARQGGKWVGRRALKSSSFEKRRKAAMDGDVRVLDDHPYYRVWEPLPGRFGGTTVTALTQVYMDLVGEAFLMKVYDEAGRFERFQPIPPTWVKSTPTASRPTYEISYGTFHDYVPDTEMVWMKEPNPVNPFGRGVGAASVLADELETDEAAAKHVKRWFTEGAVPPVVVGVSGGIQDQKRAELKWRQKVQGFLGRHEPMFFGTDKLAIHRLDSKFSEMQVTELRKFERDAALAMYGAPPEWFGIVENSNRATIEGAETMIAKWVVLPRLERLRWIHQMVIAEEFDPRIAVHFENPVPDDIDRQLEAAKTAPWALRVDEWRALVGLDSTGDETGSGFVRPRTLEWVPTLSQPPVALLATPLPPKVAPPPALGAKAVGVSKAADVDPTAIMEMMRDLEPEFQEAAVEALEALGPMLDEGALATAIETGDVEGVLRLLQLERFGDEFESALAVLQRAVLVSMDEGAKLLANVLGGDVGDLLQLSNPEAEAWLAEHGGDLITELNETTRTAAREILTRGYADGKTPREIAKELADTIGLTETQSLSAIEYREKLLRSGASEAEAEAAYQKFIARQLRNRARTISYNELAGAMNKGQEALWRTAVKEGFLDAASILRTWIVTPDDRLCPYCSPMGGQTTTLDGVWETGIGPVYTPTDIHVACRCTQGLVFVQPGGKV